MKQKDIKPYMGYDLHKKSYEDSRDILASINKTYRKVDISKLRPYLKDIADDACIIPPFYFDHGIFISIGKNFYSNTNLVILDEAEVTIGDNVIIGPNVSLYTPSHPIDKAIRQKGLEYALPITIEDDVWIAGGVIILPGVTIKSGSIIGAGSVVTKDIPSDVIAMGNPCRVFRKINDEDRKYWQDQYIRYKGAL